MRAAIKPTKVLGFDGVDDQISIDGSSLPGNHYDFERTDQWSLAIKFNTYRVANIHLFYKILNNVGFRLSLRPETGDTTDTFLEAWFHISYSSTENKRRVRNSLRKNTEYIAIGAIEGDNQIAVVRIYDKDGLELTSLGQSSAGLGSTTKTLKNAAPLQIGLGLPGYLGQASIWNVNLFALNLHQELATRMVNDTVKNHSVYNLNCVGYWREFVGKKAVNAVNRSYDGTLNNFS